MTFIVGSDKEKFSANKILLALLNEVFKKQFFGGFQDGVKDEVIIADVNPSAFKQFLSYLNFGEIDVCEENVKDVYELADRYLDEKLKDVCADQIISTISYQNIFITASWNYLYENEKIKEATDEYFDKNQMACLLVDQEGFKNLKKMEILRIVRMNPLNCSEELLLKRVLEWGEANKFESIEDLLSYIRLELDAEYNILDYFSKPSRANFFDKIKIGDLMLSDQLESSNEMEEGFYVCFGFVIILSNYDREEDHLEKFSIVVKSNNICFFEHEDILKMSFTTNVKEHVAIRKYLFEVPLIFNHYERRIEFCVTFNERANRYHYNKNVLFPYFQRLSKKQHGAFMEEKEKIANVNLHVD